MNGLVIALGHCLMVDTGLTRHTRILSGLLESNFRRLLLAALVVQTSRIWIARLSIATV